MDSHKSLFNAIRTKREGAWKVRQAELPRPLR